MTAQAGPQAGFYSAARLTFGLSLVAIAWLAWWATPALPTLDDGYIALDSAQSLIRGSDSQYGSPPLTGVTSPPFVGLLAILLRAGLDPLVALRVASWLGLLSLALAALALGHARKLNTWKQCVVLLAVVALGPVVKQSVNGVETGWAMAVATGMLAAYSARRFRIVAATAALLPWLRPDLVLMSAAILVLVLRSQSWPERAKVSLIAAVVGLGCGLWLQTNTGAPIPQTIAAKASFFAESCLPVTAKTATGGLALLDWLKLTAPVSLLAVVALTRSRLGWIGLACMAAAIAVYILVLPGALWHNEHRYLYPITVPWLLLGVSTALATPSVPKILAVWFVMLGLGLVQTRLGSWRSGSTDGPATAEWIREHVPPDARLLVHDAGVFALMTPNPIVDLVGLKTPGSIIAHQRWTAPSCGEDRERAVYEIARNSAAQFFVVTRNWDGIFRLTDGLRRSGATLTLLRQAPEGDFFYNVYAMTLPPHEHAR